jgi:hypothetical protein
VVNTPLAANKGAGRRGTCVDASDVGPLRCERSFKETPNSPT